MAVEPIRSSRQSLRNRATPEIEAIRRDPQLYVGTQTRDALFAITRVLILQAFAEVLARRSTAIRITNFSPQKLSVQHRGPGLPITFDHATDTSAIEDAFTAYPSDAPLDDDSGTFPTTLAVACALSAELEVTTLVDGIEYVQKFARGRALTALEDTGRKNQKWSGITIAIDPLIFGHAAHFEIGRDSDLIKKLIREQWKRQSMPALDYVKHDNYPSESDLKAGFIESGKILSEELKTSIAMEAAARLEKAGISTPKAAEFSSLFYEVLFAEGAANLLLPYANGAFRDRAIELVVEGVLAIREDANALLTFPTNRRDDAARMAALKSFRGIPSDADGTAIFERAAHVRPVPRWVDRDPQEPITAESFLREHYGPRLGIEGDLTLSEVGRYDTPLFTALNREFKGRRHELHVLLPTVKQRADQRLLEKYGYIPQGRERHSKLSMMSLARKPAP